MKKNKKHFYLKWILVLGSCFLAVAVLLVAWNYFMYSGVNQEDLINDTQLQSLRDQEKYNLESSSSLKQKAESLYPEKYQTNFGILLYHRISTNPKFSNSRWSVLPENFENQIKYLKEQEYSFVKLGDAYGKYVSTSSTTSSPYYKTLVLTFDDGYRDFYTVVFPLLKKYEIPATVFVITKDVGKNGNVTWEMLKEMEKSGLVEVGSHTISHKYLTHLSDGALFEELSGSKDIIEKQLGHMIKTLAYPYGAADSSVYEMAQKTGYIGAVRVMGGGRPTSDSLFTWRRVAIDDADIGPVLLKKIFTAFEVIK